jgi:DNA-binding transcriptional regulator/RsmH inhibitor MraZ
MFAGQGEYFTIWNPERYTAQQAADASYFESDLQALNELGAAE